MTEPLRVITQTESWANEVKLDVIEHLEYLLDKAKTGEILGIAYAANTSDNMVITGSTKSVEQLKIVGGLERIKHRMIMGME